MVTRVRQTAAALLLCGSSVMAFAQTATVKVSVTVMQPLPCTINGGRPIEVDFGDEVMTTRINGNFYRMPIDFSFTCNNPYKNAMRLQVQGGTANFAGAARHQSGWFGYPHLAKARWGSTAAEFRHNFSYPNPVKLDAVPVKRSGVNLETGEFTASATLRVDYQ